MQHEVFVSNECIMSISSLISDDHWEIMSKIIFGSVVVSPEILFFPLYVLCLFIYSWGLCWQRDKEATQLSVV